MNYVLKNIELHMAAQALMDEPEQSASERSRENACYERYCFIQVTCKLQHELERPDIERKYMNSGKAQRKSPS